VIETREQRREFDDQFQCSTPSEFLGCTDTDWYRVAQVYSAVYMTNEAANMTYILDVDSLIVLDYDSVSVQLESVNDQGWNQKQLKK
jgi:hypothetical protein